MRLTAVHVPRSLRPQLSSSASTSGGSVIAPPRPGALYGLVGVQALSALILLFFSLSGFGASLGDSQVESLEVLAGAAGLIAAAAVLLPARWAWPAAMIWVCAIMALELIVYATGDSPAYAVMLLGVGQVVLLHLTDVKHALGVHPQRQS